MPQEPKRYGEAGPHIVAGSPRHNVIATSSGPHYIPIDEASLHFFAGSPGLYFTLLAKTQGLIVWLGAQGSSSCYDRHGQAVKALFLYNADWMKIAFFRSDEQISEKSSDEMTCRKNGQSPRY